jgi:hypothetical protein
VLHYLHAAARRKGFFHVLNYILPFFKAANDLDETIEVSSSRLHRPEGNGPVVENPHAEISVQALESAVGNDGGLEEEEESP